LTSVQIVASFLVAFKAILIEGSEVAILSLATIKQLGKRNVLLGVLLGICGSFLIYFVVSRAFIYVAGLDFAGVANAGEITIDFITGAIILYFSYRFLRGFVKYYFKGKSFREKMFKWTQDVVNEDLKHSGSTSSSGLVQIPFSFSNSLPVLSITLTEGFEASLVLAAATAYNEEFAAIGALVSIVLLIAVCAVSYDYLMRVPRWFLDLLAGCVLLAFGLYFVSSGVLLTIFPGSV